MSNDSDETKELPSFIKNWNQFYGIIIVWLVFLIFVFWLATIFFR